VKFATTARTKTKVMCLLWAAKRAPPTSTNPIKEEKPVCTINLKIALNVRLEHSRQLVTAYVARVLLGKKMLVQHAQHAFQVSLAAVKQIPHVKIARKVFTKTKQEHRTVCPAYPENTKIVQEQLVAKSVPKIRHRRSQTVLHLVILVPQEKLQKTGVLCVRNVWPGSLKTQRPVVKRCVPFVSPAPTRIHQTCRRASSAQLAMHNRLRNKRRALNAAPVNSTMLPVRFVAKCVSNQRTLMEREETAVASIVRLDGRPKTAVRNVSRAARVRLALGV
jgi:hypothetical protein